jgi:hypothetical protein
MFIMDSAFPLGKSKCTQVNGTLKTSRKQSEHCSIQQAYTHSIDTQFKFPLLTNYKNSFKLKVGWKSDYSTTMLLTFWVRRIPIKHSITRNLNPLTLQNWVHLTPVLQKPHWHCHKRNVTMKVVLFSWTIIIQLSWPENWIEQKQLESHGK